MAIRSGFFNSVNGDRKYSASHFAEYFASFIGNGVFPNPSDGLQVMANDDMTVTVKAGKAWINGYIMINDDYILEIEPADGVLNRIDRIVARYDVANREITLEVKQGTFASSPVAPSLQRDADAYEIALADIKVNAGVIKVTQADITDTRLNKELCGIVHGTVEQIDTTTLFNQYVDWYQRTTGKAEIDIEKIKQQFQNDINRFLEEWQQWFSTTTEIKEQEFDTWFETIKGLLDEDIGTKLAAQILELEQAKANKTELDAVNQDLDAHKAEKVHQGEVHGMKFNERGKLEVWNGVEWIELKGGGLPVNITTNIQAVEGDKKVELTWQDPEDILVDGETVVKWKSTAVVRKQGSMPKNDEDGVLIGMSSIRNQYKNTPFLDTNGLENDKEYFYGIFPQSEDEIVTVSEKEIVSAIPTAIGPNSWQGIQKIVRQGLASEYFSVGDQLVSEYDGGEIVWEVIGIDVDTPADSNYTHSMTLQTKDCLHDIQFDAREPNNPNSDRKNYGNNRYIYSAVRQWLNSNEPAFNWQSQHQYDAKPTSSLDLYEGAGFLNRLDPELVSVLGAVNKKVAKADADGGGQDTFSDKVFLLSQKEVGLGEEGDVAGEFVYPFYDGIADAGRIKQLNGSNRYWWLRSPYVSNVRSVYKDGSLYYIHASPAIGVSPACVII